MTGGERRVTPPLGPCLFLGRGRAVGYTIARPLLLSLDRGQAVGCTIAWPLLLSLDQGRTVGYTIAQPLPHYTLACL